MLSPTEVRNALEAGNIRFAQGTPHIKYDSVARAQASQTQRPKAVVIGCSDSRVPVETIFDVQMGELFVIRTAGHVLAAASLASLRYAIEVLGARTIVVLGHEECGAVDAALRGNTPYWLHPITSHIRIKSNVLSEAVDEHVIETMDEVVEWINDIGLEGTVGDKVAVFGGAYNLKQGLVHWLERSS